MEDWGTILPRLQRFYGGNITDWLNIPFKLLNAYATMLPIIEAEESLSTITIHAVASGSIKADESKRIMNKLQKQTELKTKSQKKGNNKNAHKAKAMVLTAMGIEVVDERGK